MQSSIRYGFFYKKKEVEIRDDIKLFINNKFKGKNK